MRRISELALAFAVACTSPLLWAQSIVIDDESACAAVASHIGGSEYEAMLIGLPPIDDASMKEVEETMGGKRYGEPDPGTTYLWHLDIDGDGLEDRFAIDYGNGTMHLGRGYFLSGAPQSKRHDFDAYWDGSGALDLTLISMGQRFYVVSSTGTSSTRGTEVRLDRLWRLAGDGEFHAVCKFESTGTQVELVEGSDSPFCKAAADHRVPKPEYNLTHTIAELQSIDNLFWSKYPTEGIARVDIDNDGSAENVMRVRFSSSAGRGCSAQYLVVTDESRSSVQKNPMNELLLERLGGFPCGPDLDLLIADNVAYIDTKGSLDRNIFRLRGLEVDRVCGFHGRQGHTYRMLSSPPR